jgi:hypothetical protein
LSTFVSNHDFVMSSVDEKWPISPWASRPNAGIGLAVCTKSAQQSANSEHDGQTRCQSAVHRRGMAKIIPVQFRRSRLPRRLLNDGWWLESTPARPSVIAFRKPVSPKPKPDSKATVRHFILVTSEK